MDVIAVRVRRKEPVDPARGNQALSHDPVEKSARVREELLRLLSDDRVLENLRIPPAQLPRVEERRPVDERHEVGERHVVEDARAREEGNGKIRARPVEARLAGAGRGERQERLGRSLLVFGDEKGLFLPV